AVARAAECRALRLYPIHSPHDSFIFKADARWWRRDSVRTVAYLNEPQPAGSSANTVTANYCTRPDAGLRNSEQERKKTMRFTVFKLRMRVVAARLSLIVLALAMGIGAAGAIFHPGLLDALQPSVVSSAKK